MSKFMKIAIGSFMVIGLSAVLLETNLANVPADTSSTARPGDVKSLIEKFEGKAHPSETKAECDKVIAEMHEKKYSKAAMDYVLDELKCPKK